MNIAAVVSNTYPEITHKMLEVAKEQSKSVGAEISKVIFVDGCFDMPLAVKHALDSDVDAVITLGTLIKGETDHDSLIANAIAKKFVDLSVEYHKPVGLGIGGPKMSRDQAVVRIESIARKVVKAVVNLHGELNEKRS